MTSCQKIKDVFSKALAQALLYRYGKIPSAQFVAKEFNLRAVDIEPVSQESVRKWLRGLAIPELNKLLILQDWLGLDLNSLNVYSETSLKDNNDELHNDNFLNKTIFLKKLII